MQALTIRTTYPCCGRSCRIRAVDGVPAQRYERRCRGCNTRWDIKRQMIAAPPVRIDRLDWLDCNDRVYVRTYGV